MLAKKNQIE